MLVPKPWLAASMVACVVMVAALAFWDEERESASALDDFAREQSTLAQSVASDLRTRLAAMERDARIMADDAAAGRTTATRISGGYVSFHVGHGYPQAAVPGGPLRVRVPLADGREVSLVAPSSALVAGIRELERGDSVRVLVKPPTASALIGMDGQTSTLPVLLQALDTDVRAVRLGHEDSAALGLPARMSLAGLAHVDAGALGRFGVAVVASAERERDRERRARWRLFLAVGLAGGLIAAFGGLALGMQRKELELARRLEVAELTRESEERLARLSKAATTLTLASGFAHELGTPLGVIVGRAEQIAARAGGDERTLKSAEAILSQADRVHEVIRGFLTLARGGSPAFEMADPSRVVRGAVALVEHRFNAARVKLVHAEPHALQPVRCDVRLLEHALVNLLLNACDASPPGSTVEASVEAASEGVVFAVVDHGSGITAADASRVTVPFFTTKPAGRGTGLGLAIANEIVKSHHGSLSLTATPEHGTRATLALPLGHGATPASA